MADGTTIGKAYIQIMPSTKGIGSALNSSLTSETKSAGTSAGLSIGSNVIGAITKVVAAAGLGKIFSDAISTGADLEQNIGGVETLFKDSADTIKEYAQNAYKTAGISANSYMEQSTSFAAALLSSTGGDTKAAAEAANQAIVDMSDNANKMGTSLDSIQNAYAGFAKSNYTMLDNLKLGYGGTKEEMERLLADAEKISGVKYDISNLSDVYSAIHVIQDELDITGTTAEEAATTFSGSLASMQSAWTNLLGDMANGGDVSGDIIALVDTAVVFLRDNAIPMIGTLLSNIPVAITTAVQTYAPTLMATGKELISNISSGISTAIPEFLSNALPMIKSFSDTFRANFGEFVSMGCDLLLNIAQGIADSIPVIVENIPDIITNIANCINDNAPKLVVTGAKIIGKIAVGLVKAIPTIVKNIPKILRAIVAVWSAFNWINLGKTVLSGIGKGMKAAVSGIKSLIKDIISGIKSIFQGTATWSSVGKNIIKGIITGLKSAGSALLTFIKGICKNMLGAVKDFFGIHSPSKVMADQVGKFLPAGIAVGIENAQQKVTDAMNTLGNATVSAFNPNFGGMELATAGGNTYNINGITYDDGSNVSNAVSDLIRAARIERRA